MQSITNIYKIGYGPSSSHTIGPVKAAGQFSEKNPRAEYFKVKLYGSLTATGRGHNTDVVLQKALLPKNVKIEWNKDSLPLHPNGMVFEAYDSSDELTDSWEVYSIGGGDLKDKNGLIGDEKAYLFNSLSSIMEWTIKEGRSLWEFVEEAEGKSIWDFLKEVWQVMKDSITRGLDEEGVLPPEKPWIVPPTPCFPTEAIRFPLIRLLIPWQRLAKISRVLTGKPEWADWPKNGNSSINRPDALWYHRFGNQHI